MRQVTSDFITWEYCLSFSLYCVLRSCFKPKIPEFKSVIQTNTVLCVYVSNIKFIMKRIQLSQYFMIQLASINL